eukprot:scaffold29513_cov159-Amphora_coffeaeformis.AAC.1
MISSCVWYGTIGDMVSDALVGRKKLELNVGATENALRDRNSLLLIPSLSHTSSQSQGSQSISNSTGIVPYHTSLATIEEHGLVQVDPR